MSDIDRVVEAYARAWMNSDSEAFVAVFTPDAVYRDDQAGRLSRGSTELLDFHRHFVAAISGFQLKFSKSFQSGPNACLEWVSSGVQSGTYHGRPPTGRSFQVPGASVLTVAPNGLISSCTDYYNGLLLQQQLSN